MLTSAQTGKNQAAHFLAHKVQEFNFRLSELLSVTEESSRRFAAKTGDAPKAGRLVNFHFSALSALVQTFKDLLPAMTGSRVSWNQLANVRHLEFLRDVRNAITHDGNPVINMWVDGRFYVGADFVRQDQRGHPVLIHAPQKDIHALVLEFAEDFCTYLRAVVIPLLGQSDFQVPLYGSEFFNAAIMHPAVPPFARKLYAEADLSALAGGTADPLAKVLSELDALVELVTQRRHAPTR